MSLYFAKDLFVLGIDVVILESDSLCDSTHGGTSLVPGSLVWFANASS